FAVLGVSGGGPHAAACGVSLGHRVTCLGLVSTIAPPEAGPPFVEMTAKERLRVIVTCFLPWPLTLAIYMPLVRLFRAFPDIWFAAAIGLVEPISEKPKTPSTVGQASPSVGMRKLPPAHREEVKEPYRQG